MAFSNSNFQTEEEFSEYLKTVVSPSEPISTIERLVGRADYLKQIRRALLDPGKQVFIIGERGVGKTSLANTSANIYQSSDASFIKVNCAPDTTYKSLIANIAIKVMRKSLIHDVSSKNTKKTVLGMLRGPSYEKADEITVTEVDIVNRINSIADGLAILEQISQHHSDMPVVVVDEVDQLEEENIPPFSHLIKALSDQEIKIKFIFTAVAKTIDFIFNAHESIRRQIELIELPRMGWDERVDLVNEILSKFGIIADKTTAIRIAAISDGFPFYIHFLLQKMLWEIFEREEVVNHIDIDDYYKALNLAIEHMNPEMAKKYNMAINRKVADSEYILWATSIGEWITNNLEEMYDGYKEILWQLYDESHSPMNQKDFNACIKLLVKPSHGPVLMSSARGKRGDYEFVEKMFKGFIRMQAELHSISIRGLDEKGIIKPVIRSWSTIPVPLARTGYHQSRPPQGFPRKSFLSD